MCCLYKATSAGSSLWRLWSVCSSFWPSLSVAGHLHRGTQSSILSHLPRRRHDRRAMDGRRCLVNIIRCFVVGLDLNQLAWQLRCPSPPLDNIWVVVIVWRITGKIIRTVLRWIMWHNVHSPQHIYVSSSYRSNRLDLSHWDPYAVRRGGCLELYYCNMVEWFWWDSSLISTTNWFRSVLWHCLFGHLVCKNRPRNDL